MSHLSFFAFILFSPGFCELALAEAPPPGIPERDLSNPFGTTPVSPGGGGNLASPASGATANTTSGIEQQAAAASAGNVTARGARALGAQVPRELEATNAAQRQAEDLSQRQQAALRTRQEIDQRLASTTDPNQRQAFLGQPANRFPQFNNGQFRQNFDRIFERLAEAKEEALEVRDTSFQNALGNFQAANQLAQQAQQLRGTVQGLNTLGTNGQGARDPNVGNINKTNVLEVGGGTRVSGNSGGGADPALAAKAPDPVDFEAAKNAKFSAAGGLGDLKDPKEIDKLLGITTNLSESLEKDIMGRLAELKSEKDILGALQSFGKENNLASLAEADTPEKLDAALSKLAQEASAATGAGGSGDSAYGAGRGRSGAGAEEENPAAEVMNMISAIHEKMRQTEGGPDAPGMAKLA